jgi:hypothetical protein
MNMRRPIILTMRNVLEVAEKVSTLLCSVTCRRGGGGGAGARPGGAGGGARVCEVCS